MKASQLLLDRYHVEELQFSLDDDYLFDESVSEPVVSAEDLDVEVTPFRHPDEPRKWFVKLRVSLNDKDGKFPYSFSIALAGFFDVSEDCLPDMVEPLALINAPSILYAAARELLSLVTARSRYLAIFLPSVRFFGPPAKPEEEPKRVTAGSTKTALQTTKSRKVAAKKK